MTYKDAESPYFDLHRCLIEALRANDREWLKRLVRDELSTPLGIRVPGWSQYAGELPGPTILAARRILGEYLPADLVWRVATHDPETLCAALARCLHMSAPAEMIGNEVRDFDRLMAELRVTIFQQEDGSHVIEHEGGDQRSVTSFSDVLDELVAEMGRRLPLAKAS